MYVPCIEWGVEYGARTLGALDLFTASGQHFPLEPFTYRHPAMTTSAPAPATSNAP